MSLMRQQKAREVFYIKQINQPQLKEDHKLYVCLFSALYCNIHQKKKNKYNFLLSSVKSELSSISVNSSNQKMEAKVDTNFWRTRSERVDMSK